MTGGVTEDEVRALRHKLGVRPVFKRIDTCAAEFDAKTPYMYSTYEAPSFGEPEDEAMPSERRKIVILGGGPNRIGQGIEFDYCCCHACFALAEAGFETIMVNCNPETVSTDYDTSDRLYFEPLTAEDVLEILARRAANGELVGVIVQFGGQTPLNLARALEDGGHPDPRHLARRDRPGRGPRAVRRAGQQAEAAPAAERHRAQPRRGARRSRDRIGYPVLMRPSYVLGGRAMEIVDWPGAARRLHPHRGAGVGRLAGADRPVSARRDRGRCRRDLRRRRRGRRGRAPAYRGGGRPFGRQRLLDPALFSLSRRDHRRDRAADRGAGARAERRRADEHPVRGQGRAGLSDRGQPARQPHGAVRRQGDRRADRQDRGAGDGGREASRPAADRPARSPISRSRKRCSRSTASPGSIRCCRRR